MSTAPIPVNDALVPTTAMALTKVQQAEVWLRDYLKEGPKPIPDSYIKNGLCRYNYPPNALPPEGVGKKTIDQAMVNLGVIVSYDGPQGGKRWSLPNHKHQHYEDCTMSTSALVNENDLTASMMGSLLNKTVTEAPEWHKYLQPENQHAAASLYPMLEDADLIAMAENIRAVGLLNPVVVLDGKVLDGRNRLEACSRARITPAFKEYDSDISPIEWVLSENSLRRQLSPSQKAVVALEVERLLAAEAKERQRMGKEKIPDPETKGQARDKAAKLVGVNERYITDAKKIRQKAPKLLAKISKGELTIGAAMKKLPKR